ncbi:MAG: O-antigen/teichoic acid export membrane protein [Cyclobacteriaceae bacterium]
MNFKTPIDYLKNSLNSPARKQVILSYLIKGAGIAISLLYVPLMLGYLSTEQFGLWVAIASIINWLRLFDIGIGNGLRFHLSSAIAVANQEKAKQLISTTYAIIGGIFVGVWLIFIAVNPYIDWQGLLNSEVISSAEYIKIMLLAVTAIVFTFILDLVKIVYAAHGDTAAGNSMQLVSSALSLLGIWCLSMFTEEGQLDLAVIVVAFSPLLVLVIATFYTYLNKFKSIAPNFKSIRLGQSKDLFNLSAKFFVVQITATVIFASLPFIITRFYGPDAVAQYHVTTSIFNVPILVIGLFTAPLKPFITQEYAKQNLAWIRQTLKKAIKLSLFVSLGTVVLILLSPYVYELWLGDKIDISYSLSVYIGIYTIINVLVTPLSNCINAIGKVNILVWLAPVGVIMFIGGCFLFDAFIGNVIAIVLALSLTSVVGLIVQPFVLKKYLWK